MLSLDSIGHIKEAVAGATAGIVGTVLGYPLDAIKTNMQTSQQPIGRVMAAIHAREGIVGFYRGIASPLVALTVLNTLNFSSYASFRSMLCTSPLEDTGKAWEWRFAAAGAAAGPLAALISTPFEMIKTQQQLRRASVAMGSWQTARHLLAFHGIRALYIGHTVNSIREVVFLGTYFGVYEHVKSAFTDLLPAKIAVPLAGGLAGAVGWFVSFPLDNIKSNIQGTAIQADRVVRKRSLQVFADILRVKGLSGLYTGVLPSVLRAWIVSASRFSAYELSMQTMDGLTVIE